ncbi:hypothetical protein HJC99_01680 [Candidatus Saccharibacteria bacterium]|nr:hypothetical protein [Candidatus Saccharibacteria bacterium]
MRMYSVTAGRWATVVVFAQLTLLAWHWFATTSRPHYGRLVAFLSLFIMSAVLALIAGFSLLGVI